jgi:hypothetical protein
MSTDRGTFPRCISVRASGNWSRRPLPYLTCIPESDFVRAKEEWLKRVMMIGSLLASDKVTAYFLTDALNWATMDAWPSYETLGGLMGACAKTPDRSVHKLEAHNLLAVYRRAGSKSSLRYAPVYLDESQRLPAVPTRGHACPPPTDTGVQESFLSTPLESSLQEGLPRKRIGDERFKPTLSFDLRERGRIELKLAQLLGDYDVLMRLAAIHDDIVTRLCEAYCTNNLGPRQIKAALLAAKQSRR